MLFLLRLLFLFLHLRHHHHIGSSLDANCRNRETGVGSC